MSDADPVGLSRFVVLSGRGGKARALHSIINDLRSAQEHLGPRASIWHTEVRADGSVGVLIGRGESPAEALD